MTTSMEVEDLMQEWPGESNYGRRATRRAASDQSDFDGQVWPAEDEDLDGRFTSALDSMRGGCQIVQPGWEHSSGMVAHRGALTEEEFESLDWQAVYEKTAKFMGSSTEELDALYGQGLLARNTPRRNLLDARFLELQESGANMHLLAASMGWTVSGGRSTKMDRALTRARKAR